MDVPKHDHWCRRCNNTFEVRTAEPSPCPHCLSTNTHWLPQLGSIGHLPAFFHPHLGHDPVYIDSVRTMDRALATAKAHCPEGRRKEPYRRLPQSDGEARHRF